MSFDPETSDRVAKQEAEVINKMLAGLWAILRGIEIALAMGLHALQEGRERIGAGVDWLRQSEFRLGPPHLWEPGPLFEGRPKNEGHAMYRREWVRLALKPAKLSEEWTQLTHMAHGMATFGDDPLSRIAQKIPISVMHTGSDPMGDLAQTASVQGFMGPIGAAVGVARTPITAWLSIGLAAVVILGGIGAVMHIRGLEAEKQLAQEQSKQWRERSATAEANFDRAIEAKQIAERKQLAEAEASAKLQEEAAARRARLQRREMERANADQANRDDVAGAVERRLRDLAQPAAVSGVPAPAGGADSPSGVPAGPGGAEPISAPDKPAG